MNIPMRNSSLGRKVNSTILSIPPRRLRVKSYPSRLMALVTLFPLHLAAFPCCHHLMIGEIRI